MTHDLPEKYPLAETQIGSLRLIHEGLELYRDAIKKRGVLSLAMCVLQENGIEDARKQISFFLPEYSNPLFRPLEKYKTEFMYDEAYKEACNDAFTDYQNRTMKSISKGTHFESADIGLFLIEPEICDVVGIHQERMANFIGYCIAMLGRMERKECHEVAQKIAPYQIPQVYIISKYIEEQSNEPLEDLVYCA